MFCKELAHNAYPRTKGSECDQQMAFKKNCGQQSIKPVNYFFVTVFHLQTPQMFILVPILFSFLLQLPGSSSDLFIITCKCNLSAI